ncbi:ROK family transcriptional regulator [Roseibium salinum]|uniref:ROK family transcriptional regulator n=1 Tax=Roseibium salinum TaxID=1604349 RepID=A0ABT3R7P9_9HYPH|nr:ROK family transcriptional regulator [Roseibium sp. DSM 29163]MCX2725131.1 ROK family transcriptional regulator [Roseibium sp. DSM 29163]
MTFVPHFPLPSRFAPRGEREIVSENERRILRLIWRHPGVQRSAVTGQVELTQQSVYRIVDALTERGMVVQGAPVPGHGRGQPSPTLRLNGGYAYSCGISLNADEIGVCLMDMSGKVLAREGIAVTGQTMAQALEQMRSLISALSVRCGLSEDALLGIGFAIAGYNVGGTRYNAPLPLHEWSLIELGPLLNAEFSKPIWIYNASQTAAVAESMFGVGRHVRNFAYLFISYGFGGALIHDGELLTGGHYNAGEFACILQPDEIARRPALKYLVSKLEANGLAMSSIAHLRRAFKGDWPGVAEWLDDTVPVYNRIINAIIGVYDPQAIVFGGEVPRELTTMLIARTEIYDRPRYGVPHPLPKFIAGEVNDHAPAIGAAAVPFKAMVF